MSGNSILKACSTVLSNLSGSLAIVSISYFCVIPYSKSSNLLNLIPTASTLSASCVCCALTTGNKLLTCSTCSAVKAL